MCFQYFDSVTIDTPVLNVQVRAKLKDVLNIKERLPWCRAFVDYLDRCRGALKDSDAAQLWKTSYAAAIADIEAIQNNQ
jgi:hypothetical protein